MNNRILEQLEFDKVKQLFAGYLQTEQGQDELRKLPIPKEWCSMKICSMSDISSKEREMRSGSVMVIKN